MDPTSDGMVPVSELVYTALQHATHTHRRRRAKPEARSENTTHARSSRLQPPLSRHDRYATTDKAQGLKAESMLTAACQWHPGAIERSATTTCTCAAPRGVDHRAAQSRWPAALHAHHPQGGHCPDLRRDGARERVVGQIPAAHQTQASPTARAAGPAVRTPRAS